MAQGALIQAERRRRLSPVTFVENQVATLDIPRDTVIKRAEFRLAGYFAPTYASGSPLPDVAGVASRICPRLDCVIDGNKNIKSVDIYMLEKEQMLLQGIMNERAWTDTGAATTPTTKLAGTEASYGVPFTWPTSTYYIVYNESFTMYFEMPWCDQYGREATLLNVKGVSSAEFRFAFGAMSNIQRYLASPVAVTYGTPDLQFVCTIIEAQDVPRESQFMDYKQTVKRVQFSSESRDTLVDLPKGNLLANVAFLVRNGDNSKVLSDIALRDIKLLINGSQIIQSTSFLELQTSNRGRYGVDAKKTGGRHSLEGYAFMNLIKNGDIRSALDTRVAAGVDLVQLSLTTAPSSGTDAATYTNPVEISLQTGEIVGAPNPQAQN